MPAPDSCRPASTAERKWHACCTQMEQANRRRGSPRAAYRRSRTGGDAMDFDEDLKRHDRDMQGNSKGECNALTDNDRE